MAYSELGIWQMIFWKTNSEPATPRRTANICCWWIKSKLSSSSRIVEVLYLPLGAWCVSILKAFTDETDDDFNNCDFFDIGWLNVSILKSILLQWRNTSQISGCIMLQNPAWVKNLFKMLYRAMDFTVTQYAKFTDVGLDFRLN